MKYLDLFSGIGGFALGLQQAGFTFTKHYFSEIDKYAIEIYKRHFPEAEAVGDVSGIDGKQLGEIDFITFGFPCQDLSIAGKRTGLSGRRSGLFYEATRLIREYRPQTFIFENVKGLFSSNGGKDFTAVLQEIADIGLYECEWQLLNTSWFLPQNRERIYFIGHLGKGSQRKVFPLGESHAIFTEQNRTEQRIEQRICSTIDSRYGSLRNAGETYLLKQIGTIGTEGIARTIKNGGGMGAKTGLYKIAPTRADVCQPCLTPDRIKKRQKGRRFKNNGEPKSRIRRLTPPECERLQGFPDGWTEGISDTQRYKCLGNAVSVPVVKAIGEGLWQSYKRK